MLAETIEQSVKKTWNGRIPQACDFYKRNP